MMRMKKRILITGGAGFIGSHLCTRLLSDGHEVICLDNLFTGTIQNIAHLSDWKSFRFIKHDITLPYYEDVDEIYNLACPASPIHYQYNPVKTTETSVLGALNVLNLAKQMNCKVLQASTSEVYGDPFIHPQPETYWGNVNPVGIRSCYDEGKRCAETLFTDYHRQEKVKIKIVRIFNTYGPAMSPNDGRVIPNFIMQALQGDDITIYGDGYQTRSFQYIDDLIEGMITMMSSSDSITGPVNIGNPGCYSMLELAEKIISLTNSSSKIIFKPLPQDDPKKRRPNIDKAKQVLNWEPKIPLEEGLIKTIQYFETTYLHAVKQKETSLIAIPYEEGV